MTVMKMRFAVLITPLLIGCAHGALAASTDVLDLRVGKLEKEMHAVQRKVFPSGTPAEPEITAVTPRVSEGNAASPPIADLTQRVDLLEAQVKTLTGQNEQFGIILKRLEEVSKAHDARLKVIEAVPVKPAVVADTAPKSTKPSAKPIEAKSEKAALGKKGKAITSAAPATDKKRQALVDAVPIPEGTDEMENSYTYAYRLFEAKLYPEARTKLEEFVGKYARTKRYSYAQNLLGRAYYEDGSYGSAAKAFVENYTKAPKGDRAAESLSWAGMALIKDSFPTKACRVFKEFDDVYGTKANKDVLARVTKGRVEAKCTG